MAVGDGGGERLERDEEGREGGYGVAVTTVVCDVDVVTFCRLEGVAKTSGMGAKQVWIRNGMT